MIQKYWAVAIIFAGCTLPSISVTATQPHQPIMVANGPTVSRTTRTGDWEVTLTQVHTLGNKVNYHGVPYEAVGIWTTATVTVRNTTSQRQEGINARSILSGARLVDTQEKSYAAKHIVADPRLSGKPLSSGESRTYTIMFDTPTPVQMSYLKVSDSYLGF